MAEALSLRELNRATLARQMLLGREKVGAVEAVGRLAGMQAQEPRPPFVGLWSRVEGFERGELDSAIASREVVRATLMRATLHLLPADDYWLYRRALEPALDAAFHGVAGKFAEGLDFDKVLAVARKELSEPRNFKQLTAALVGAFPDVDERAPRYFTRTQLPLLMVPTDDRWGFPRTPEFELAERQLGKGPKWRGAGGELVRRYLAAFGPASVADFATWSGIRKPAPLFEELRDDLSVFTLDGGKRELFDLPDAPRPGADVPAPVRFLPDFDNLVLGHADRTRIVSEEHRPLLTPGKNLRVKATFLVDGFVAGTWKAERKGKNATLVLEPFVKLKKAAMKELTAEAEALLRFLEPDAATFIAEFSPL
ncbi:MAG: hypothetical protein QOE08_355 [Thermoleophilaceae bacterium]|nr:hypothetical protein [Thermoleophilaceae bacterium]